MDNMYFDFAVAIKKKLSTDLNGAIKFEIYSSIDTIIFKVRFKDFEFQYGVNNISDIVYSGSKTQDEIVQEIELKYKEVILKSFFKSTERKRKEERLSFGIYDTEVNNEFST